jgi:hypothetical protein
MGIWLYADAVSDDAKAIFLFNFFPPVNFTISNSHTIVLFLLLPPNIITLTLTFTLRKAVYSAKKIILKSPESGYTPKDTLATRYLWAKLDISRMLYQKKVILEKHSGVTLLTLTLNLNAFIK